MVFHQLLCHLAGDFFLQSDWVAGNKYTKKWVAALHAVIYTLPFLLLTRNPWALAIICVTHGIIDHYKVANYVAWAKNWLAPRSVVISRMGFRCSDCDVSFSYEGTKENGHVCPLCGGVNVEQVNNEIIRLARVKPWVECKLTGYDPDRPIWLTVWLSIITDNSMHIAINYVALRYFP